MGDKYPKGAFESRQELQNYFSGGKEKTVYLVLPKGSICAGAIEKHTASSIKSFIITDNKCDFGFGFGVSGNAYLFKNYWDAYAHGGLCV